MIGLPVKNGVEHGMFEYEKEMYDAMQVHRRIWVKKARGLGVTEFILRYMAWLCLRDREYFGAQMAIVVGPKMELGVKLVNRMKTILANVLTEEYKANQIILNGCEIEAYPSNHTEALRSPENMKFIFLDEADFFNPNEVREVVSVSEGYTAKSNPYIVMVSTPHMPGGFYETIERDVTSPYHKIILPYTRGEGLIYTKEELAEAMKLRSFEQEYNLKYGYGSGNMFEGAALDDITQDAYDLRMQDGEKVLAVDPGYGNADGSSKFAIVGAEMIDGIIYIKYAQQIARASPEAMTAHVATIFKQGGYHVCRVDGSQSGIIRDLEEGSSRLQRPPISVEPVMFREMLTDMSGLAPTRVRERMVRIHPDFKDLIAQLRSVEINERGHPDKKKLTFDLGDAFLMAVSYFQSGNVFFDKI